MHIPRRPRWVSRFQTIGAKTAPPPSEPVSFDWQPTPKTPPIDYEEDAWVNSHHIQRVSGKLHPLLDAHNERHTDPDATVPRMPVVRKQGTEPDTLYTQAVQVPVQTQVTGQHERVGEARRPSQALTRRSLPIDWLIQQAIERFYVEHHRLPHGILLNPVRSLEHGAQTHQWHSYTYRHHLDGCKPLEVAIPLASAQSGELGMDEIRLF